MSEPVTFELSTDLLWNSTDPARYAELVTDFDQEERYETRKALQRQAFDYYDYVEDGKQETATLEGDHLQRNIFDIEPGSRERSVKLGGINLFTYSDDGYFLSEEGAALRDKYLEGDEIEWKSQLANMVLRYFPRARCMIYYLGVHGCEISSSAGLFKGPEALQKGDTTYYYYQDSSCKPTSIHYVRELRDAELVDEETPLGELYNLEYTMASSGFSLDAEVMGDILRMKHSLEECVDSVEDAAGDDSESEISSELGEKIQNLEEEIDGLVDEVEVENPLHKFNYVPNLLIDANLEAILGPYCIEKAEEIVGGEVDSFRIRGVTKTEPATTQIVRSTRYAMRLLWDLGVVVESDEGDLIHDSGRAKEVLNSELIDQLFQFERVVDDSFEFLEALEEACLQYSNPEGVVDWASVKESVTEDLGLSENKFDREVENQQVQGKIRFEQVDQGQPWQESPPGMDATFVRVIFD